MSKVAKPPVAAQKSISRWDFEPGDLQNYDLSKRPDYSPLPLGKPEFGPGPKTRWDFEPAAAAVGNRATTNSYVLALNELKNAGIIKADAQPEHWLEAAPTEIAGVDVKASYALHELGIHNIRDVLRSRAWFANEATIERDSGLALDKARTEIIKVVTKYGLHY